jgi:hypothetical protein
MKNSNQPEEELNFLSFAEVGNCEHVFEMS